MDTITRRLLRPRATGQVTVNGEVTEDLLACNGPVVVGPAVGVGGDVVSLRAPAMAATAAVRGQVLRVRSGWGRDSTAFTRSASWTAVSVSTLALGLLLVLFAPHPRCRPLARPT